MLSIKVLCDLIHLRNEGQGLPQLRHNLLGWADVHYFKKSWTPGKHAERHARRLTDHPRVVLGEGLVVGLSTHGRRFAVLSAGAQALQEELQPPQGTMEPQQSAAARLRMGASLAHVHEIIVQLVFHHRLQGGVVRAILTLHVIHQDLDLADSILRNEAKNAPQAVQKPVTGSNKTNSLSTSVSFSGLLQLRVQSVKSNCLQIIISPVHMRNSKNPVTEQSSTSNQLFPFHASAAKYFPFLH